MYFLVQSNISSDPEYNRIYQALEELDLEYETIEVTDQTEKIETRSDRKDVFLIGSVKLARLAKANSDWYPGSFYGGNHLFEVYAPHYDAHLLNFNAEVFKFDEKITWKLGESKFIKPYQDAKIFTGKVFTETKWNDFVADSLTYPKTSMLHKDSLVQASAPQDIIKEARLWIIGKKVSKAVYYKILKDVPFEAEVAPEGLAFAREMIDRFNVAEAFVMDICLTYEGWKIVEINCVNTAGFYPNLNVKSLFKELNAYFSQ